MPLADYLDALSPIDRRALEQVRVSNGPLEGPHGHHGHGGWHGGGAWGGGPWGGGYAYEVPVPIYVDRPATPVADRYVGIRPGDPIPRQCHEVTTGIHRCSDGTIFYDVTRYTLRSGSLVALHGLAPLVHPATASSRTQAQLYYAARPWERVAAPAPFAAPSSPMPSAAAIKAAYAASAGALTADSSAQPPAPAPAPSYANAPKPSASPQDASAPSYANAQPFATQQTQAGPPARCPDGMVYDPPTNTCALPPGDTGAGGGAQPSSGSGMGWLLIALGVGVAWKALK